MSTLRSRRHVVALALLSGLVSCTEPSAPVPVPTIAISISRGADWFAYRNDGGEWTSLAPSASGAYEFLATPRVAVAWAINQAGVVPNLSVAYTTAESFREEAARLARGSATSIVYTGTANGVARNIPTGAFWAYIGHGPNMDNITGASAASTNFSLLTWSAPMDLVATLVSSADSSRGISMGVRAILRRGQRLSPGSAVTLDFDSPEFFPLGTATLAWTGPELGVEVEFISATGSRALLSRVQRTLSDKALLARTRVVSRMPPERLVPGDLHQLQFGDQSSNSQRVTTRWTHTLADTDLDLGPPPLAPTVTLASSGANSRPRFVIPARAELGDYVIAAAEQQGTIPGTAFIGRLHSVTVLVTKRFLGATPDAWTLEVPDLRRVAGFPSAVLLAPGGFSWTVYASGGNCATCADSVFDGRVERRWSVGDTVR